MLSSFIKITKTLPTKTFVTRLLNMTRAIIFPRFFDRSRGHENHLRDTCRAHGELSFGANWKHQLICFVSLLIEFNTFKDFIQFSAIANLLNKYSLFVMDTRYFKFMTLAFFNYQQCFLLYNTLFAAIKLRPKPGEWRDCLENIVMPFLSNIRNLSMEIILWLQEVTQKCFHSLHFKHDSVY